MEVRSDRTAAAPEAPVRLSIVLATLNERRNLPELLDRLRREPLPSYEILVADDGSSDGTREYLEEAARADPRIRLLYHDGKQTTLRAQARAIARARGDRVVVMDADLQHPPETVPHLLDALDRGAPVAVASRYAVGGTPGPRTFGRIVLSRGAEWTARLLLPPARRVSDPVSGFFAFRREVWVPLDPRYRGYKLLLFVLAMAGSEHVAEVGYRFEPRASGVSKVTQGPAFVRHFLVETMLARRFSRRLEREATDGRESRSARRPDV